MARASPIDDNERALASFRNRVGYARRNNVNLTLLQCKNLIMNLEVHLAFDDKKCFVKVMCLIRIGKIIHAKNFDVRTSGFPDEDGPPRIRQFGYSFKIDSVEAKRLNTAMFKRVRRILTIHLGKSQNLYLEAQNF